MKLKHRAGMMSAHLFCKKSSEPAIERERFKSDVYAVTPKIVFFGCFFIEIMIFGLSELVFAEIIYKNVLNIC